MIVSTSYSFSTLVEQIILPYGYVSDDASNQGVFYNGIGVVGGVLCAILLNKERKFKTFAISLVILEIISFASFWY